MSNSTTSPRPLTASTNIPAPEGKSLIDGLELNATVGYYAQPDEEGEGEEPLRRPFFFTPRDRASLLKLVSKASDPRRDVHNIHEVTMSCVAKEGGNEDKKTSREWEFGKGGRWKAVFVFDGHAGPDVSSDAVQRIPDLLYSALSSSLNDSLQYTVESISSILSQVLLDYDDSILKGIKSIFPDIEKTKLAGMSDQEIKKTINDNEENQHRLRLGMRGSTALIGLIDGKRENLWVAGCGDSEAIIGTRSPSGVWTSTCLSTNHNGGNEAEVEKVRREHPDEEECILNQRVLGAIAVTRALGDHFFKLPNIYTEKLFLNVAGGFKISRKVETFVPRNKTPPYLTAKPDVQHHKLLSGSDTNSPQDIFIIFTTDGLRDLYSQFGDEYESKIKSINLDKVWVELVGRQIERKNQPKTKCQCSAVSDPGEILIQAAEEVNHSWAFDLVPEHGTDQNLAFHLLYNSLGGESDRLVSANTSLEGEHLQGPWMDDTTIVVLEL